MKQGMMLGLARRWQVAVLACVLSAAGVEGQETRPGPVNGDAASLAQTLSELQAEVRTLNSALAEMRADAQRSHAESLGLRQELHETRAQLALFGRRLDEVRGRPAGGPAGPGASRAAAGEPSQSESEKRVAKLEEDQQLLKSKVDDQYQSKVESASKYRIRLSGIALLNVFGNRGSVDNLDLPSLALARGPLDSGGDFGATVRQSSLGLEVFGASIAGAKASADLQFDFFGGFPGTLDSVNSGIARMRTATLRMDWAHTSFVAGQDTPFFSPLSPTSMATLAVPALAYSGNLWTWTPQMRVERRFELGEGSSLRLQSGILDAMTGEPPYSQFYRAPQAGERSRQPAYASRLAWTYSAFGRPFTLGAGGYYSRQNWGFNRHVDGWAGTADWSVPAGRWFLLTGEFYRGRAIGGLGGGIGRSVLFSDALTNPAARVLGLNSMGGWTQLKFRPSDRLEFNTAVGQDNPLASDLRSLGESQSYLDASLARNQTAMVNFIYRPHSDVLLSLEYRRLQTFSIYGNRQTADHVNLGVGVLF